MTAFDCDPADYLRTVTREVPDYECLQAELIAACADLRPRHILDLGTGSGETARRLLTSQPQSTLVGIDASETMLGAARQALAGFSVSLRQQWLQDPLPTGPFDLVVTALAVHHLDVVAKADLFRRVRTALAPEGRFVLADLVVPPDPQESVSEIDWMHDVPSSTNDQLKWLRQAGFTADVYWRHRDLVVLTATA
jgi:tRNA (cmo5U34)-methyltransferase